MGEHGRGEVLTLIQRSARRREFELRREGALIGWLRFPPGRRSVAEASAGAVGPLALTAGSGRVEVRGGGDGGGIVATVERGRRGPAVVRVAGAPALGWRRAGPGHRWVVDGDGGDLLRVAATQGLLRASVRITVQRAMRRAPRSCCACWAGSWPCGSCRPGSTRARPSGASSPPGPGRRGRR